MIFALKLYGGYWNVQQPDCLLICFRNESRIRPGWNILRHVEQASHVGPVRGHMEFDIFGAIANIMPFVHHLRKDPPVPTE